MLKASNTKKNCNLKNNCLFFNSIIQLSEHNDIIIIYIHKTKFKISYIKIHNHKIIKSK